MRKIILLGSLGLFMLAGASMGCGKDKDNENGNGNGNGSKCGPDEMWLALICVHKCFVDENLCSEKCPQGEVRKEDGRCGPPAESCPAEQDLVNGQCRPKCASGEVRGADGQCKKSQITNKNTPEEQLRLCKAGGTIEVRSIDCMMAPVPGIPSVSLEEQDRKIAQHATWCEQGENARVYADSASQPDDSEEPVFKNGCARIDVGSFEACASSWDNVARNGCNLFGGVGVVCNLRCLD